MTAATCSGDHGSILRRSTDGGLIDRARQGLRAMRPSSTAAPNTDETLVRMVRTYVGASSCWSPRSQAWTTDGLMVRNSRRPKCGIAWRRMRSSVASRVASVKVWASSHCSAKSAKVTLPASGSTYAPRSTSAVMVARNRSASALRAKSRVRSCPSGSRYRACHRLPLPWRAVWTRRPSIVFSQRSWMCATASLLVPGRAAIRDRVRPFVRLPGVMVGRGKRSAVSTNSY